MPGLVCPPSTGRQPVAGTAVLGRGCGPGVEPRAVIESHLVAERGTVLGSFTWAALDNGKGALLGPQRLITAADFELLDVLPALGWGLWAGGENWRQGGWPGLSDQEPPDGRRRRREVRRTGSA